MKRADVPDAQGERRAEDHLGAVPPAVEGQRALHRELEAQGAEGLGGALTGTEAVQRASEGAAAYAPGAATEAEGRTTEHEEDGTHPASLHRPAPLSPSRGDDIARAPPHTPAMSDTRIEYCLF